MSLRPHHIAGLLLFVLAGLLVSGCTRADMLDTTLEGPATTEDAPSGGDDPRGDPPADTCPECPPITVADVDLPDTVDAADSDNSDNSALPCGVSNCPFGCCTAEGICLPGTTRQACGRTGHACAECTVDQSCTNSVCVDDACGECAPGDTRPCGACEGGTETCGADCAWGTCEGDGPNACGGCATLEHAVDEPCCGGGVWMCAGPDTIICNGTAPCLVGQCWSQCHNCQAGDCGAAECSCNAGCGACVDCFGQCDAGSGECVADEWCRDTCMPCDGCCAMK